MRVFLVGPELEENLGLRYLAAALQQDGHECRILPYDRGRELPRVAGQILRDRPDLVGLALVAQHRFRDAQALVERLRERGYRGHLTAGGHFASLRAPEVLADTPGLDTVLHHDAEERIVALARCLGLALAPIISSRGCAGRCSFCSIHAWHRQVRSGRLRFRAPEQVAAEMARLHAEHGVRVFVFHDDDFLHPDRRQSRRRCEAILDSAEAAIGEPIAFVIKARPDDVDETLFRHLKARGLVRVYVGIETHSRAGLPALNRRVTPEQNQRALAVLKSLDVYACFNLLVYHPDSTAEELDENLAFLEQHLEVPFDVARTEIYARSALEDRMLREGRAIGDYRGFDYRIADPVAEASFRLFRELLWERHFGSESVLRRVQGLRLRLSLLERFHPESTTPELRSRAQDLVRETNSDTVRFLRRLGEVARRCEGDLPPDVVAGLEKDIGSEIRARLRSQGLRWAALSLEVEARAALGRSGLRGASLLAAAPRAVRRLAALVPGTAALLGAVACEPGFADPPPPPCTQDLVLWFSRAVPPNDYVVAPFTTTEDGRLDVTVDWTFSSSPIGVFVAPGACSPEQFASGTCDFVATSPSGAKPRRLSVPSVRRGSYQLVVVNWGERPESMAAQVLVSGLGCPSFASLDR